MGQFELLERIGRGGMGEVWRARDIRLERDVALKTLPASLAADEALTSRLAREARVMATLNHPNIAAILGLEEQDGSCWLVLELVNGPTLAERLVEGPLSVREAADIAVQVAAALQAAHSRGIVHCDLKPSNIKILSDGRIKVLDFGIARNVRAPSQGHQQTTLTVHGEIAGTPAYMSPEQMRGGRIDPASDIWAFGVLLYHMLAGRIPFPGPTMADTFAQVLQSEPDLSMLLPQVPQPLIRLLSRCLQKEPQLRIQHAGDLRILIEEALATASSASTGAPLRSSVLSRRPWRIMAGLGTAVVLVGVLGWLFHARAGTRALVPPTTPIDASIAVLPFVNMSADSDQEYFSDGLTEELINQLAHVEGLLVTARTSAFAFKGRAEDLRTVGRALNVAHVLEGSVRKSGDRIRVTVQLINTADGYHTLSESYDRALTDVFAIQDEIAAAVVGRLRPSLGTPRSIDYGGTTRFEAYDHLLRGIVAFNGADGSQESIRTAAAEYRRALAIDPNYSRASAELAIALSTARVLSTDPALRVERDQAAARAIESAPNAPLTQVVKMWVHSDRHEWIAADAACAALFAAPSEPRANWICGGFLSVTGRVRDALPRREVARSADPLSASVAGTLVRAYALLDMGPELEREYARLDGLAARHTAADQAMLSWLARTRAPAARFDEVLARLCTETKLPCAPWVAAIHSPAAEARSTLRAQLDAMRRGQPDGASTIAFAAAYLGDRDLALDALEVFSRNPLSSTLQEMWYPLLSDARKDPRFKRIVRDVGFEKLWRSTGRWGDYCRPLGADDFECF